MAAKIHGVLGSSSITSTSPTVVYAVPTGRKATVAVNLTNAEAVDAVMAVSVGGAIIEIATPIAAKGVLERTGITLSAGQTVSVTRAAFVAAAVHAAVWGIEEDA